MAASRVLRLYAAGLLVSFALAHNGPQPVADNDGGDDDIDELPDIEDDDLPPAPKSIASNRASGPAGGRSHGRQSGRSDRISEGGDDSEEGMDANGKVNFGKMQGVLKSGGVEGLTNMLKAMSAMGRFKGDDSHIKIDADGNRMYDFRDLGAKKDKDKGNVKDGQGTAGSQKAATVPPPPPPTPNMRPGMNPLAAARLAAAKAETQANAANQAAQPQAAAQVGPTAQSMPGQAPPVQRGPSVPQPQAGAPVAIAGGSAVPAQQAEETARATASLYAMPAAASGQQQQQQMQQMPQFAPPPAQDAALVAGLASVQRSMEQLAASIQQSGGRAGTQAGVPSSAAVEVSSAVQHQLQEQQSQLQGLSDRLSALERERVEDERQTLSEERRFFDEERQRMGDQDKRLEALEMQAKQKESDQRQPQAAALQALLGSGTIRTFFHKK